MREIFRDPQTNNYNVDITVDEWKEILCLPDVLKNSNIIDALEKWYKAPLYTASCKELGYIYGHSQQYFSVQNRKLGEIAVRYVNRFKLIGANDMETFWAIALIEVSRSNGVYILQLRPELVKAIGQLNLFA